MTAIVMNLATAAVTEYDWTFPALCATHAGSDDGLFALGGDDDAGAPIDASLATGVTLHEGSLKNGVDSGYLTMTGEAGSIGLFSVFTPADRWDYEFAVLTNGVSRAKPGKGIRENMLGFGYANLDGANFSLSRLEVRLNQSQQRRA
jgi:hypothetical protein